MNDEKKVIKNVSDEFNNINPETDEINEVTWFTKIIYAISAGPSQIFLSAINVFSTVFLLESVQLSSAKLSYFLLF
jgi:hypothetical protein